MSEVPAQLSAYSFDPDLGSRILRDSLSYECGNIRRTAAGASKQSSSSNQKSQKSKANSSCITKAEGINSIKVAQRSIKEALSLLSTDASKENSKNSCNASSTALPAQKTTDCLNLLYSAAHTLRSVIGINPSFARAYELSLENTPSLSLEKICYHVLVGCVDLGEIFKTSKHEGSSSLVLSACKIGLATYEMLGLLVKNYVASPSSSSAAHLDNDPNIVPLPRMPCDDSEGGATANPHSHITFSLLPIPSDSFSTGSTEFDRQLCKIVVGATMNAARCASELALLRDPPSSYNFGSSFERELALLSKDPFAGSTILYSVSLTYMTHMAKLKQVKEACSYR